MPHGFSNVEDVLNQWWNCHEQRLDCTIRDDMQQCMYHEDWIGAFAYACELDGRERETGEDPGICEQHPWGINRGPEHPLERFIDVLIDVFTQGAQATCTTAGGSRQQTNGLLVLLDACTDPRTGGLKGTLAARLRSQAGSPGDHGRAVGFGPSRRRRKRLAPNNAGEREATGGQ